MTDRTTDTMLDELAKIGLPTVRRMDSGGWHANLKLPTPDGVKMEIASDFNHPTHRDALECVIRRLGDARGVLEVSSDPALEHK